MRDVQLLSYSYPDTVRVLVKSVIYTYESSEPICRNFMVSLNYGLGFHALNYFKRNATLISKEETNHGKGIRKGQTARMLPEG